MTILGLAESFRTMDRPEMTQPGPAMTLFDGFFLRKSQKNGIEILTQS